MVIWGGGEWQAEKYNTQDDLKVEPSSPRRFECGLRPMPMWDPDSRGLGHSEEKRKAAICRPKMLYDVNYQSRFRQQGTYSWRVFIFHLQ
jgi:hypothetical protein